MCVRKIQHEFFSEICIWQVWQAFTESNERESERLRKGIDAIAQAHCLRSPAALANAPPSVPWHSFIADSVQIQPKQVLQTWKSLWDKTVYAVDREQLVKLQVWGLRFRSRWLVRSFSQWSRRFSQNKLERSRDAWWRVANRWSWVWDWRNFSLKQNMREAFTRLRWDAFYETVWSIIVLLRNDAGDGLLALHKGQCLVWCIFVLLQFFIFLSYIQWTKVFAVEELWKQRFRWKETSLESMANGDCICRGHIADSKLQPLRTTANCWSCWIPSSNWRTRSLGLGVETKDGQWSEGWCLHLPRRFKDTVWGLFIGGGCFGRKFWIALGVSFGSLRG